MIPETLFDPVTVHCFWGWCDHTVTDLDADTVHGRMEAHYSTVHRADIDALLPRVTIRAGVLS